MRKYFRSGHANVEHRHCPGQLGMFGKLKTAKQLTFVFVLLASLAWGQANNQTNLPLSQNPATLNVQNSLGVGNPPPTVCGTATDCIGFAEGAVTGLPALGFDYLRMDTSHLFKMSLNNGSEFTSMMNYSPGALPSLDIGSNYISDECPNKAATCTLGNLSCITATNTCGDCGQGGTVNGASNGVIVSCGPPVQLSDFGINTVNSTLAFQAAHNDVICSDPASGGANGMVVDVAPATSCPVGQELIGYARGDAGSQTSHLIDTHFGDLSTAGGAATRLDQLTKATQNGNAGDSGNNNIPLPSQQTGSTNFIDLNELVASTGTGAKLGISTVANSTAATLNITQGDVTTTGAPGPNANLGGVLKFQKAGDSTSLSSPGGYGASLLIKPGKMGLPNGTGLSDTAGNFFPVRNMRMGAVEIDTGTSRNPSSASTTNSGWGAGPWYFSPALYLHNPTASTGTWHQEAPMIASDQSGWSVSAMATFHIVTAGSGYSVGDILNVAGCSNAQLDVTSVSGGGLTGLAFHLMKGVDPSDPGIPEAGSGCSVGSPVNVTEPSGGSGGQISIDTVGGPTYISHFIKLGMPCVSTGVSITFSNVAGNAGQTCVQFNRAIPQGDTIVQWYGFGPTGGGAWIQALGGGFAMYGWAGDSAIISPSGNLNFATGPGTLQRVQFGYYTSGTQVITPTNSIDQDNQSNGTGVFTTYLTSSNSDTINDGSPVKMATATSGTCTAAVDKICYTVTTDTGPGVVIGVNIGACLTGAVCHIATTGFTKAILPADGVCANGNDVIVSTSNAQKVMCVAVGTASGSKIGTAQAAVGGGKVDTFINIAPTGGAALGPLTVNASDFTTSSASLVTITGLSKALPVSLTAPVTFSCNLIYSEATASTAVVFGVQTAVNAPTNLAAGGEAYVTPTTLTEATPITGISSTTAQNVIAVTPTSIAGTKLRATISGTIEGPSASGTTLNIQADIASGIVLTVYRGSMCQLQ